MKKALHYILALSFIGSCSLVQAQTDCSQALIQAERAYYTGRFSEVETLLAECITKGFDKDQKTEAYKLIALSKIFSRNFDQADSALLLMLTNNPQYTFVPQDPPEFRKRVEDFNIHPLVEVTANLGLVIPSFKVMEVYNSRTIPASVTYKGKLGSQFGLSAAYYLNKNISVRLGYEWQNYSFTIQNKDSVATGLLTETQTRSQWQTAVGYNFIFKKISLQVYGGVTYSTLHKADGYLVLDRVNASGEIDFSYSNLPQRTLHELRPMMELKLNVPQKNKWLFSFSVRYELGIQNMTNTANRYSDLSHTTRFEWVEDDFKGRNLVMMVGISKLFYRVKAKQ